MGVFSGHDFNWLNLLFKRDGKCQDAYYQFCNTHFSFCLYTLLARGANLKIQAVLNKRWQISLS